jgi:hypothetical protein
MESDLAKPARQTLPLHKRPIPKVIARVLVAIQADLLPLTKTADNTAYGSKFAPLPEVMTAATTLLVPRGVAITQPVITDDAGHAALETTLIHESGAFYTRITKLAVKSVDPQSHASAITYMRRYALMAILGLTSEDDDDDGNTGAGKEAPATEEQKDELKSMLVHLKFPSDIIAKEIWGARTRDQAALKILNYRKMVSTKVNDITAAAESSKIEVQGAEDSAENLGPIAGFQRRINALRLASKSFENKFISTATDRPFISKLREQDYAALESALAAVESGVRHLPAEWLAPRPVGEHVTVEEEIA